MKKEIKREIVEILEKSRITLDWKERMIEELLKLFEQEKEKWVGKIKKDFYKRIKKCKKLDEFSMADIFDEVLKQKLKKEIRNENT